MPNRDFRVILRQVIRYGVVGVLNNLWGYLLYLLVTWLWLQPKTAVTILYPVGALSAYFAHAKFSFKYEGQRTRGLLRFVIAHFIGYAINVSMLYFLVDVMGWRHQLVQVLAIFVVAGVLFVLFRYYVFPVTSEELLTNRGEKK